VKSVLKGKSPYIDYPVGSLVEHNQPKNKSEGGRMLGKVISARATLRLVEWFDPTYLIAKTKDPGIWLTAKQKLSRWPSVMSHAVPTHMVPWSLITKPRSRDASAP
jgi:hypothetical protein